MMMPPTNGASSNLPFKSPKSQNSLINNILLDPRKNKDSPQKGSEGSSPNKTKKKAKVINISLRMNSDIKKEEKKM
jgi:hypothetical protein